MILFIKKIIYQAIIFLLISFIADYFLSSKLRHSDSFAYGESFIWNEILEGHMSKDILIYGSSRAWVHFDSQIIEDSLNLSTYNLGIDGHNFWLQYLRHKKVLEYNIKPKIIILSVGIFSLNKRKDLYNLEQFLPYIHEKNIYKFTSVYKGFSILDYTLPLYRYLGHQDAIKLALQNDKKNKSKAEQYRVKGFRGMDREWNDDLAKAKLKLGSFTLQKHEPSELLMKQFLKECHDLGIKVIIVYSPEHVEGQRFVTNRNSIIEMYNIIAKENNLIFLDYSNDPICSDKDLFYNSLHLNSKGAKIFTNRLVSDLKQLHILNQGIH